MTTPFRYLRAFIIALGMTLRGEKPPPPPYPEFSEWVREMAVRVDALYRAADANGLDQRARQSVFLRLDGREMSLEIVFSTFRYHATHEYPFLLRSTGRFNRSAVQAANMNDRHWLSRLREEATLQNLEVQAAIAELDTHLAAIPSIS
jgi:hypothetical protein